MGGALFDTLVVMELVKTALHRGEDPGLYFWRTAAGEEVDLVLERESRLIPLEIKVSGTPRPEMATAIARFAATSANV
jgi:predicted AAA+ superfamily ATPase